MSDYCGRPSCNGVLIFVRDDTVNGKKAEIWACKRCLTAYIVFKKEEFVFR